MIHIDPEADKFIEEALNIKPSILTINPISVNQEIIGYRVIKYFLSRGKRVPQSSKTYTEQELESLILLADPVAIIFNEKLRGAKKIIEFLKDHVPHEIEVAVNEKHMVDLRDLDKIISTIRSR